MRNKNGKKDFGKKKKEKGTELRERECVCRMGAGVGGWCCTYVRVYVSLVFPVVEIMYTYGIVVDQAWMLSRALRRCARKNWVVGFISCFLVLVSSIRFFGFFFSPYLSFCFFGFLGFFFGYSSARSNFGSCMYVRTYLSVPCYHQSKERRMMHRQ
ncbi:uncharacterized protein CLUP02_08322 [Colletotrichum lupini]|uniref:Transmembrane protein n=1 Tax=Colletotrichum lupini TaxID=145971 RepID=A0A9Q8SUJ3_9PEZI|nr:uncharacterized protein CLUP02_08322 [Colletotrichum lupini]UQC82832.1 hypothetical protein CLUP02_08322 [Colletotrichum lupini]